MRKRLLSLVLVVFGLMILSACTDKKIDLDTVADELVNIYQSGDSEKNVTKDLNLKTTTTISNDVVISWNSSNQDIVSNNGKVNRPNDNDVNVELVLTVSYESLEAKRTFNLVVKKTEDVIVEKVSVSFDYWYENAPSGLVIEIDKNTKVTQIEDPIRVGYKFVGWFNGEEKYDFNLNVSADLDLVARWERFLDITLPESVTTSVIEIIRGTEVTLTVNVPNGKELVSLKVNEQIVEVTNNKYTFIATEDIIVLVEFKDIEVVETYSIELPDTVVANVSDLTKVTEGTSVTLTVNIPEGKELVSLKVNEETVEVTNNKYTFIATEDIIVLVEFKDIVVGETYSIELPDTVVANVNDLTKVAEGTSVTLTVNVPEGKELVSLKVNEETVEVTNNKYTFIATEDIIVLVEFKDIVVGETYSIELPDTVVANVNDLTKVTEGTSVTLTVNIPEGKELVSLKVNEETVEVTNNKYTFVITTDVIVLVEFKDIVVGETYSIELPDTVVANVNDLTKVAEGTSVTLTVNVPNGKELVELIVDGNKVEVTNNQYTFEITKDIVVSVEYKNAPIYYTITLPEWVISSAGTRVLENTETGLTIINIPQFDLYYSLLLNGKKVNVEEEKYYNFVVTENIEIKIEFNLDKIEITPILEAQNSENGDVFIAGILSKKVGQYKYQVTNQEGSIEVSVYEDQAEDVLEYLDALIGKKVILKTDKYDDFIYIYYTADVLEYDYVEKEKYDVTFNTNGGSQLESIKVVEGKKITKPSNPEKLNSIFVGWFSDEELTVAWDFDQVVNSAVTLYAKWDLVSFTKSNVFTISEDGKIIYQAITVLVNGVKILVTDATELLLIDGSLYVNALEDKTYEDILEINGELITVSYSFEKEIVEVTSAAISGEFKYNSELGKFYKGYNVLVDGNILEIKDPEFVLTARKNQDVWTKGILTNTGSGVWFDSNKEQGLYEFVAIDKDGLIYLTTIDFTFESKTYEVDSVEALLNVVEINKNETETTIILINDIVFEVEREIRFINKVTITGGKELKNVYLEVIEGSNIEGITVTEPEKTRHTVIFESEGLEIEKVNVIEGQKVAAIANPERQGYIFAGWLNNDTIFNFDTEINSNITLTAKWDNESISGVLESIEANSKTITITFTSAVKFKGIRLEELDLTSADTKFELLNSLFFIYSYTQQQEREVLSSALMNIENVQIITSKDSIKITLGDNVFNREFYKQIVNEERYENGIYRMTVERLEYNDFTHAINDSKVVGGQENTSFRVKFSLPFANGVVDLDGTLNAIFQTKEQAENDSATDPKVDKYAPQIEEAEFNIVNGRLVLVVKAYDENLKELEIDHNLERLAELPEFSVYADSTNPYGDSKNAFEQLGVIVTFKDGEWTITFGESREEIIKNNTNKFVVYFVVSDYAGNKFGSMDPTTPGNTIEINVYNVSTTIYEDVIEKKVFEGEKLDLEAPKSNDEYMFEFDAWYLDNTKYDVNEPVNSDLALVAKFNEIVYLTIEEVLALGKGKDVKVRAILEKRVKDSNFDIIDSTGRIRIYKSKSDSELSNAIGKEVIIIGTRDVYDREQVQQIAWTEIKILDLTDERKLHYVSNSDLTEVRKFEVEMGSEVMLPTEITKLGIKVDIEWNLDEFVTDNKFNSVTESKTVELVGYLISGDARKEIKAELIIKKVAFHEITFKVEGFEDIIVTYKEDEDIKSPNFSLPEGKRITGWYLDLELTEVYEFGKATSALIIYGKVEETSYLIVTYNLNGGNFEEGIVPKTEYINDEKLVKPENPVREGFAFVGWFRDELLQTEWIFIDDEINSNITLYAKWEEKNEEINTYDLDFINVNYPTSYSSGKYSVKNLINGEQTEIVTFDKVFKDNGARLNKKGSIVIELESKIKRIEIKIAIWTVKETTSIEFQTIDGSSWKKEFELIEKMNSPKDKQYVSIVLEGLDIDRFKLYSDGRFLVQNIKIWQ